MLPGSEFLYNMAVDWTLKTYTVSSGTHTLKWRYTNDQGENSGWVDFILWTGASSPPDPENWQEITYKHDVAGRRVEKHVLSEVEGKVDGYTTRYVHDGSHIIAEYDGNNNLLHKYIYGPQVDEPISMIDVAGGSATYYYHFDALGSVVALSDSTGDTVQTYEYSVYGEVSASDPNHPNPYMFAGRRFDIEIGLYYNRARYYNPYTGRFLQTDPIGYGDGMNWYAYCNNNPVGRVDPSGKFEVSQEGLNKLAHIGGLWALSLKVPDGRFTSWIDFFAWYAHGGGDTLDLREVGLLGSLRGHEKVAAWEEKVRRYADEEAKLLAKKILWIGKDEATVTIPLREQFDFGGGFGDVLFDAITGIVMPSISDPLVVLGDFTINATVTLRAWRDPTQPNKAYWSRTIEYSMNDSFSDPGDILDQVPGVTEWIGCEAFAITASWTSVNGGWVIGPTAPE